MAQSERLIQCERKNSAAWIWFDRDSKRNAWTPDLVDQFTQALISANGDDEVRSVVVAARGKCFCAGMDLNISKDLDLAGYRDYYRRYENLRETIKWLSKPVIARINGDSYGDGVAVLECFDIIVAVKEAKFGLREVNAGLSAGGFCSSSSGAPGRSSCVSPDAPSPARRPRRGDWSRGRSIPGSWMRSSRNMWVSSPAFRRSPSPGPSGARTWCSASPARKQAAR